MEEHFILRVPQSVADRLERILNENPASASDEFLDLAFQDARSGTFTIGEDRFKASLLDLPCVLESYKTYDDNVLIKTADIGQMIMVQEGDAAPEGPEYRHGLTPAMRDARRRRFRREPDINPDLVQQVENDLQSIMAGGTARDVEIRLHLKLHPGIFNLTGSGPRNIKMTEFKSMIQSMKLLGNARYFQTVALEVEVVEQEEDANDGAEAEKPAPRTTAASKKAKAGDAVAAAPPAATDEPMGDGDDDFDDQMEEDEEDD